MGKTSLFVLTPVSPQKCRAVAARQPVPRHQHFKTAKALGLSVPNTILVSADEVIE